MNSKVSKVVMKYEETFSKTTGKFALKTKTKTDKVSVKIILR